VKILVTPTSLKPDSDSPALKKLRSFAPELVFNTTGKPLGEEALAAALDGCDGCVAGLDYFTAGVIEGSPKLRVISRYGAGFDRVDLDAARKKNIVVCNTPGAGSRSVAELALALLLCVARRVPLADRETKGGLWPRMQGIELFGKTIGILGFGAIGRAMAQLAAGFSMKVLACDPFIDRLYVEGQGVEAVDFQGLISRSDFISLHLPLNGDTKNIICAASMESMKKGAVIINTARGGLIDEAAAYDFLLSGRLGGLGLDVYETEPPPPSPLFALENVVCTPHCGAHTAEAVKAMADTAVENLIDVLSGRPCKHAL